MDIVNKGYLHENFRLFHLKDQFPLCVETHYHDFDKFVMVCSGTVDYAVEGISYHLLPGDILFIRHHDIHRPTIYTDDPYERYVLWILPEYLEHFETDDSNLSSCFSLCSSKHACHFRPTADQVRRISAYLFLLDTALSTDDFGKNLLIESSFVQLLVLLNRIVLSGSFAKPLYQDPLINNILEYINSNLNQELSVDLLAAKCFLSRYYFMRKFKDVTGYTVHYYIQQKRLAFAVEKIISGCSINIAAKEAGFSDYSSFLKTFRKVFNISPSEFKSKELQLSSKYYE